MRRHDDIDAVLAFAAKQAETGIEIAAPWRL